MDCTRSPLKVTHTYNFCIHAIFVSKYRIQCTFCDLYDIYIQSKCRMYIHVTIA